VVRVARGCEPEVTIEQIAKGFGVHPMTLQKWLRRAGSLAGKMIYPLVRDLAATGILVTAGVRVLGLARQPQYRWLAAPITASERTAAYRANALFDAHRDDPDRTAWRIASDNGWWCTFGKKRGKNGKKPSPAVHDDLCVVTDSDGRMRHEFTALGPNQLWLTDITEHKTAEGKVYRCAIKDVFANKIVGYSIDSPMKSSLAVRALENAAAMRGNVAGCVVHSDRGSQFRSRTFLRALARHRMVGSMGRVASCGDNAAMESFFSLLQKNVLNRRTWSTREQLRIAIVTWIERTYHRRRHQSALGRLTPTEFETIMNTPTALTAPLATVTHPSSRPIMSFWEKRRRSSRPGQLVGEVRADGGVEGRLHRLWVGRALAGAPSGVL
jgi:putative transposase